MPGKPLRRARLAALQAYREALKTDPNAKPPEGFEVPRNAQYHIDRLNGFVPRQPEPLPPPAMPSAPAPPSPEIAKPEQLSEAVDAALRKAKEILEIKLDPGDPAFTKLMSTQASVASAVLGTIARVDEGKLRGKTQDQMGALLARLRATEGSV